MSQAAQWLVNAVTDFSIDFHNIAESKKSYFEGTPAIAMMEIDGKEKFIDSIDKVAMKEADGRNIKVQTTEVAHLRRKITVKRYNVGIDVDKAAVRDMSKDPTSKYAERLVSAMNRQKDYVIAQAATADVLTGTNGLTVVDFATDGGQTVDATAGLTYDKILEIQANQSEKATGAIYGETSSIFITDQEMTTLLNEQEVINNDFNEIRRVDGKQVVNILGMDIIQLPSIPKNEEPVLRVTGGKRECLALAGTNSDPAIYFATRKQADIQIDDISFDNVEGMRIQATIEMGAVRQEGERVIKIETTPAA